VLSIHTSSADSVLNSLDIGRLAVSATSTSRRSGSPAATADRWIGAGSGASAKVAPDIFSMADMFIADIDGRSSSGKATPPVSMVHRQKISYHCQFGDSGEGDGQFTEPSGVAVNMITGDILVADANNHRVQVKLVSLCISLRIKCILCLSRLFVCEVYLFALFLFLPGE